MSALAEGRFEIHSEIYYLFRAPVNADKFRPTSRVPLAAYRNWLYNEVETTRAQLSAGEEEAVDWQEKYLDKLDRDFAEIKAEFRAMRAELQASVQRTEERVARIVDQTLAEMRERDAERREEFRAIRSLLIEERRWVVAMAVTTILGVAAMVISVLLKG